VELASPAEDGTARPLWVPPRNRECSRRQLVGCSSPSLGGRASDHPTLEEPAPDGLGVRSKPVADAGNPRAIRESTKDHPSPLHNYLTRGFSRFGRLERPENHRVRIPLPPPSQNSSDKALCRVKLSDSPQLHTICTTSKGVPLAASTRVGTHDHRDSVDAGRNGEDSRADEPRARPGRGCP